MKFYSAPDRKTLPDVPEEDYRNAHEIGVVRVGKEYLFFRRGLKHFAMPYSEITKIFRRVRAVPAELCCGKGNIEIESLIVCTKAGEAAELQLPGARAARALWEELKKGHPEIDFTAPAKSGQEEAPAP